MQLTRQSKIKYWSDLMTEWKLSGETQAPFCELRDIKITTFHKWRQRLKEYHPTTKEESEEPQFF